MGSCGAACATTLSGEAGRLHPIFALNELLLAIRLRRRGCELIDTTWLATELAGARKTGQRVPIPHWRTQLAGRDTDAVPLPTRG